MPSLSILSTRITGLRSYASSVYIRVSARPHLACPFFRVLNMMFWITGSLQKLGNTTLTCRQFGPAHIRYKPWHSHTRQRYTQRSMVRAAHPMPRNPVRFFCVPNSLDCHVLCIRSFVGTVSGPYAFSSSSRRRPL